MMTNPCFVACKFNDRGNKVHIVQDKIPIVAEKCLDTKIEYPQCFKDLKISILRLYLHYSYPKNLFLGANSVNIYN